jgi:hypothetical protein
MLVLNRMLTQDDGESRCRDSVTGVPELRRSVSGRSAVNGHPKR